MGLLKKIIPLVLLVVVVAISYWWSNRGTEQVVSTVTERKDTSRKTNKPSVQMPAANVVVDLVKIQNFSENLNLIGNGRAVESVELIPWSAGIVDKIFASAGDRVQIGDVLAKLDSEKEEIAVARAKVQRDNSELTFSRILTLRSTNTATEMQEITARLELENADLTLRDAQLALDRREIRTPINGTVGIMPISLGSAVSTNTVISRVENKKRILVDIWVPEHYSSRLHEGDEVMIAPTSQLDQVSAGRIYALDNVVNADNRTFHAQIEIQNEKEAFMSGMSFVVTLQFHGGPLPVINPLAVQWDGRGSFVWRVTDGKAEYVPVSIIQRQADRVFVQAPLEKGDKIVIQGVQMLQPDRSVLVQNLSDYEEPLSVTNEQDAQ
ncbi:efflux RND transporter periplasmic adaptor subunit [Bartonella ancashensis]|uniref:Putative Co/Zn/Cd efflux system membrane fusion protein n=1 Tax=Bartonella ancashensis TaxID=1318743 RepID=A0A0M5L0S5_9HYPH|nr:efflux RND transporter periplasmic adaptor subunit [Bartonella ancashensis]ALE02823.1 putative Co/Zn/Cd efflux system membrane fusion protein [Bartonella ancashensis]